MIGINGISLLSQYPIVPLAATVMLCPSILALFVKPYSPLSSVPFENIGILHFCVLVLENVIGQSPPAFTVAISPIRFFSRFGQPKI